jgi:GLPGLI family protein
MKTMRNKNLNNLILFTFVKNQYKSKTPPKSMKKNFLLIIVLNIYSANAQSHKIDYGMRITDKAQSKVYDAFKNPNSDEQMVFSLFYDDKAMKFQPIENDAISEVDFHINLMCASSELIFFRKFGTDEVTCLPFFEKVKKTAHVKKYKLQWKILNETKTILGKTCKKAVGYYSALSDWDSKGVLFDVEAWFAPSMQPAGGPRCIGDLPGMILELKYISCSFIATKIYDGKFEAVTIPKI